MGSFIVLICDENGNCLGWYTCHYIANYTHFSRTAIAGNTLRVTYYAVQITILYLHMGPTGFVSRDTSDIQLRCNNFDKMVEYQKVPESFRNSRRPIYTVYPKKYAHGFCFAVLCCGYTLTDFPISIRHTSLALWQSNDCPSASKATLMNMDNCFMWIHYERLHNHNKAKHNKTVCIFSWDILYHWASSTGLTAVSQFKPRLPAPWAVGTHHKGPTWKK